MGNRNDQLKTTILDLLDEHKLMTVATLRSDGWPQATVVGYVHDELVLYFAVALASQKHANIGRDSRISIALGHEEETRLRGLSMAAHADVVTDQAEIEAVNRLLRDRYQGRRVFAPRETAAVVIRATPTVISIIDLGKGPGAPELLSVADAGPAREIEARGSASRPPRRVAVHAVRSYEGGHRPGAPP